ncbi:flavodoxin [Brucepastera parasyntrophica]|uniref:flavodoxin n=1 Tax=Brucepastera parasyntrophica TaxID=2880008 RepID=UPI00210BE7D2|nr:flavodoxin [Brucepastera parasyntrophica]ULQ60434.1 flavodoxin [Brucepastera parasyntrophica]
MAVLIAYYSWSGNSGKLAKAIQEKTGGTLFEIAPVLPYTANYNAVVEQAKKEIRNGYRPELESLPGDLEDYDTILIGSPNWWSTIAPPLASFLAASDFSGKTLAPFITHGGGGPGNCKKDISSLCPGGTVLKPFVSYGSNTGKAELGDWLREIGFGE